MENSTSSITVGNIDGLTIATLTGVIAVIIVVVATINVIVIGIRNKQRKNRRRARRDKHKGPNGEQLELELLEEGPNENADHAEEPGPSNKPLLDTKSGRSINVRYKDQDRTLDFNLDGTYSEMKDKIMAGFEIAQTDQFHIVAKGDSKDIVDDFDVRRLSRIRFSIDVYPMGPFCIWFGKEEWSLTQMPAQGTYLVYKLKVDHLLPDYSIAEFTETLNTLLESLELANACLRESKYRSNVLVPYYHLCADELRPVSAKCSLTFEKIAKNNLILVKRLNMIFQRLRDHKPAADEGHIQEIKDLAGKMKKELGDRVDELERVEGGFISLLNVVDDIAIKADRYKYQSFLDNAVKSLRTLISVMNDLQLFWVHIEALVEKSGLMTDLEQCTSGQIDLCLSGIFKTEAAVYIASHIAIREGCLECNEEMKEFTKSLPDHEFVEKLTDETEAVKIYNKPTDSLHSRVTPRAETRREERNGADRQTVARVDAILEDYNFYLPIKRVVMLEEEQGDGKFNAPQQVECAVESTKIDIGLSL